MENAVIIAALESIPIIIQQVTLWMRNPATSEAEIADRAAKMQAYMAATSALVRNTK